MFVLFETLQDLSFLISYVQIIFFHFAVYASPSEKKKKRKFFYLLKKLIMKEGL